MAEVNATVKARFPAEPLSWVLIGKAEELRGLAKKLGKVTNAKLAGPGFGP